MRPDGGARQANQGNDKGLLLVAIAPLQQLADRVADAAMPDVTDTPDSISRRKQQTYRATGQEVAEAGDLPEPERDMLARLSDELGRSPTSVRALEPELGRDS